MAIIDTILSTPVNIDALKAKNSTQEMLMNGAFTNMLYYAKSHWSYAASGQTGGQDLLNGTANTVPCGGIATALKLIFVNGLGIPEKDVVNVTVSGYLWTGPTYTCFDPKVRGNLRNLNDRNYANGCIFNQHFYLKACGKYYDPCLSTSYNVKDQSILERFSGLRTAIVGVGAQGSKVMFTNDMKTGIAYLPNENVPGFRGAWVKFPATKNNVKQAIGKRAYKEEMARQGGNSTFAKLLNQLP